MQSELAVMDHREVEITPMRLIEMAAAKGASIDQMAQLFELKLRVEADTAKKAFNEAFTAFKAEPIRIVRDKENTQYSKGERKAMYTSLENMIATVTPFLSKHGLAASWGTVSQTGTSITLGCTLTHVLGHSKTETITGPLDESGAKNKLQQVKSSMTYLKVATFESVCGLASAFGNLDDDGNGSGGGKGTRLPDAVIFEHLQYIETASCLADLTKLFKIAYKDATEAKDEVALRKFIEAKDKRKGEL